ncbi:type II toxin-antitoxin system PemK/MazF family toxin [Pseudomonas aeruginosa]
MSKQTFSRGQIVSFESCTFDKTSPILKGLVISQDALFDMTGMALVVPVMEMKDPSRYGKFAVNLDIPSKADWYAMACKHKSLDLVARAATPIETASDEIVEEVLARVRAMMFV